LVNCLERDVSSILLKFGGRYVGWVERERNPPFFKGTVELQKTPKVNVGYQNTPKVNVELKKTPFSYCWKTKILIIESNKFIFYEIFQKHFEISKYYTYNNSCCKFCNYSALR